MNQKGLLCFLFLLAFLGAELSIRTGQNEALAEIMDAKAISFEAEKANMARASIETSVDRIIEESLRQGKALELGPEEIKEYTNARLVEAFRKMKRTCGMQVSFEEGHEEALGIGSTVIVKRIGNKALEIEYSYTGGIMKNRAIKAAITGKNTVQEFRIPAGYTIRAKVFE